MSLMEMDWLMCATCRKRYPATLLTTERLLEVEEMDELGIEDGDSVSYHRCAKCFSLAARADGLNARDFGFGERNGDVRVNISFLCALMTTSHNEGLRTASDSLAEVVAG